MTEEYPIWHQDSRHSQDLYDFFVKTDVGELPLFRSVDLDAGTADVKLNASIVTAWFGFYGAIEALQIRPSHTCNYNKESTEFMLVVGLSDREEMSQKCGIWLDHHRFDPWKLPKSKRHESPYVARGRSEPFTGKGWLPNGTSRLAIVRTHMQCVQIYYIPMDYDYGIELVSIGRHCLKVFDLPRARKANKAVHLPPVEVWSNVRYSAWIEDLTAHILGELAVRWPYDKAKHPEE